MKRRFILILLMFLLVLFSGFKVSTGENALSLAPDFSILDFQGKKFTLSDKLKNHKAILLWSTNLCKGCLEKVPKMERMKNLYNEKGIGVVAISILGKDRKTVEEVILANRITFRFLFDPEGKVTKLFGGEHVPGVCPLKNLFIIGKNREVLFVGHYPGTEENEIENLLNKFIGGEI